MMEYLLIAASITAGNFIYWMLLSKTKDWRKALEISWFQAVAIGIVWLNVG
jgi:hypothetical protein